MRELPDDNTRLQCPRLITSGLGYCCEWFFYFNFASLGTELIGARLGVSPRTVRRRIALYRAGELTCTCVEGCVKRALEGPTKSEPNLGIASGVSK